MNSTRITQASVIVILGVLAALAVWAANSGDSEPREGAVASPTLTASPRTPRLPTAPAVGRTPTPTSTPTYEGSLSTGIRVRVTGTGSCLNFRAYVSLGDDVPVNFCRPDGTEGHISDGPIFADGRWWWGIAGQGWAVDEFLSFVREENLATRTLPELEGLGKIAYLGVDGGLWIMNADGSERRRLVDVDALEGTGVYVGLSGLQWSPDGQRISFGLRTSGEDAGPDYRVRIIDLSGRLIREIPDAASAFWSPDSQRISYLEGVENRGFGSLHGTPVVFDLNTADRHSIGPNGFYIEGSKWRPNGSELVYESGEGIYLAQADGSGADLIATDPRCRGSRPNWSPDGERLAMSSRTEDCSGYLVYRLDTHERELCAELPPFILGLGRHGTAEDGQTDWSADGRFFAYHTEFAVTNRSGVYIVDSQTGEQTLMPSSPVTYVSIAPNSRHITFSTGGLRGGLNFIWIGDVVTGSVILLAEGGQPVWQPVAQ